MTKIEIIKTIKMLATSQGFYCKLYNDLMYYAKNDPINFNEYMDSLVNKNFTSALDVVEHFEGV